MCTLSHVVFEDKAFVYKSRERTNDLWAAISLAADCSTLPVLAAPLCVQPFATGGYATMWDMTLPGDVRVTIVATTPEGYIALHDKKTGFTVASPAGGWSEPLDVFSLTATVTAGKIVLVDRVIDRGMSVAGLKDSGAKVERSVSAFLSEHELSADAFWFKATRMVFLHPHVDSVPAEKGISFDIAISPDEVNGGPMRLSRERGVEVFVLEGGASGGRVRIVAHMTAS
jgi:hypothetical protein